MKNIHKTLLLVSTVLVICGTNTKAQEGKAFEKKEPPINEIIINSQVDEHGKTIAVGGIFIKDEGSISFNGRGGVATKTAGFWVSNNGKKYHVRFCDQSGNSYAVIEMQGMVRWDKNGNVSEGKENFLRIKTYDDRNTFIEITNRTANEDGELIISTLNGPQYRITKLSSNFNGTITVVPSLRYFYKSKPTIIGVIIAVLAITALGFAFRYRGRIKLFINSYLERKVEMKHQQTTLDEDSQQSVSNTSSRNIFVTVCLIILLIANLIAASIYLYYFDANELKQILETSMINENAPLIMVLLNIVFLIMLLARKKIGFFGIVTITIIAFLLNIFKAMSVYWVIGLAEIGILLGILQIKKYGISAWSILK